MYNERLEILRKIVARVVKDWPKMANNDRIAYVMEDFAGSEPFAIKELKDWKNIALEMLENFN